MDLTITKRNLIKLYNALEGVDQIDVEFDDYETVHNMAQNKAAMGAHFEALRMADRECLEYREYRKRVTALQNKYSSEDKESWKVLKAEIEKLNRLPESQAAIEKESARREKWEDELDNSVVVKNIRLLRRKNKAGEPTIRGKSAKALAFIMKIDPLFANDECTQAEKSSKKDNPKR